MVRVSHIGYAFSGTSADLVNSGPSLLGYLDEVPIMDRNVNAPFMLPVSEKYNEMGTMAMGKIESGRVKKGDSLLIMPNKVRVAK